MTKCDFCEKEAIGYCSYQCAIYCADHQKEAEAIEEKMWAELVIDEEQND